MYYTLYNIQPDLYYPRYLGEDLKAKNSGQLKSVDNRGVYNRGLTVPQKSWADMHLTRTRYAPDT